MKYILSSDSLTAFVDGKPYTVNKSAEIYPLAIAAIRSDSESAFLQAVNTKSTIAALFSDAEDVRVESNCIMYGNREITGLIARRVFEYLQDNLPVTPMLNFISNLMKNPSKRAVDETFGFVDACNLPITEDGMIIAYKMINEDYTDWYSRTVPNKPLDKFSNEEIENFPITAVGHRKEVQVTHDKSMAFTEVSMDRNLVDEDRNRTCSVGLHFCSIEYAKAFDTQRLIAVLVNPADIVAIPSDYNEAKARCCRYLILEELNVDKSKKGTQPVQELNMQYATAVNQKQLEIAERNRMIIDYLNRGCSITETAELFNLSRRQIGRIRDGA